MVFDSTDPAAMAKWKADIVSLVNDVMLSEVTGDSGTNPDTKKKSQVIQKVAETVPRCLTVSGQSETMGLHEDKHLTIWGIPGKQRITGKVIPDAGFVGICLPDGSFAIVRILKFAGSDATDVNHWCMIENFTPSVGLFV